MFESLSDKLSGIFDKLTRRGALSEADVAEALREVRRALLEADVALDVARAFSEKAQERAIGANIVKSISPGQMVIKIVNDVLIETLGETTEPLSLEERPPVTIMMVGLQGAGKTTTTAKIAKRLKERPSPRWIASEKLLDLAPGVIVFGHAAQNRRPIVDEQRKGPQKNVGIIGGRCVVFVFETFSHHPFDS